MRPEVLAMLHEEVDEDEDLSGGEESQYYDKFNYGLTISILLTFLPIQIHQSIVIILSLVRFF
jgi:hypothetical protein